MFSLAPWLSEYHHLFIHSLEVNVIQVNIKFNTVFFRIETAAGKFFFQSELAVYI